MSLSAQQARQFLGPLRGKLSTFRVADRRTNLLLAQNLGSAIQLEGEDCAVLDLNAFYATNSDSIYGGATKTQAARARLFVPEVRSDAEGLVPEFLGQSRARVLIIDNLNTLFHLFSADNSSAAVRKLAVVAAILSYFARTNGATVLASIYERERPPYAGRQRLFSGLGDTTVHVRREDGSLSLKCERGTAWTSGALVLSPSR